MSAVFQVFEFRRVGNFSASVSFALWVQLGLDFSAVRPSVFTVDSPVRSIVAEQVLVSYW